jgi:anti-anti-sigma factor
MQIARRQAPQSSFEYLGHTFNEVLTKPKPILNRLTGKMDTMNEISNCVTCDHPVAREPQVRGQYMTADRLKLSLEALETERDVTIVLCRGRIVYRDEAAALSQTVSKLIRGGSNLILDLSAVEMVDGAGLGEFVGLHNRAANRRSSFKLAALRNQLRSLLELTKLAPVFEIYPTVELAVSSFEDSAVGC